MGGNLERNRWMIIDDPDTKAKISEYFGAVGRPYLQMNAEVRADDRSTKVIDSATFLVDHLHEVPALVLAMRLDRPEGGSQGRHAGVLRLGAAGRVELPAGGPGPWYRLGVDDVPPRTRSRGRRAAGDPVEVTQVCLLAVGYYTGDSFTPAPRRPAAEVTYLNRWKAPVE